MKTRSPDSPIGWNSRRRPEERYTGEAVSIIAKRNAVKKAAFEAKRIRWSIQFTPMKNPEVVYLNKLPDVYAKVS